MNDFDYTVLDGRLLRMFITVYDTLSVTKAAAELDLTQSTVSHGLNRLRKIVKDDLFVQSGRGIIATPKADDLISQARVIVAGMQLFVTPDIYDPATDTKKFTIAANDYEIATIIKPFLKEFRQQAPHSSLHIARPHSQGEWANLLRSGQVDLVLAPALESNEADLFQTKILSDHEVCFYDANHQQAPKTIEEYCNVPHAIVAFNDIHQTDIDNALKLTGFERHVVTSAPNFSALAAMIEGTDIVATMPARLENSVFKGFSNTELPFDHPNFDIVKIWHAKNNLSKRHKWLKELLTCND
ncbi:MAG: LysR family transcriptional regulator [Oceanospirillaceae bacterium]